MIFSTFDLTRIALDLNSGLSNQNRFARLLDTVRQVIRCDASALLVFDEGRFKPLAIDGLKPDVLGRRFVVAEHPRLEIIARAGDVVRFPADSDLPDPYDGLILSHGDELMVHSCVGLPLLVDDRLIGALTIDGFNGGMFDHFDDEDLRTLGALAAASLNSALMMERLEKLAISTDSIDRSLNKPVEMIGESVVVKAMKHEIEVVAASELNVLILGETGVGKELVAQSIHQLSPRQAHALVYLNCAALPEAIAESELFGHVKGAFTGAISHRKGKFETADGGTLFLDEIGDLPLSIQAKLLRVLQYGEIQRVGEDSARTVDVRVIAATNKDLKTEVTEGRFRADLFHRLSVFPLLVPPLRQRDGDLELLVGFFVEQCRGKLGLARLGIEAAGLKRLAGYDWPGNIRELEHSIYRAAILARAESPDATLIKASHFDISDSYERPRGRIKASVDLKTQSLRQATEQFQCDYIEAVLHDCSGSWADAARTLSMDSGNLHRLAKRLGLK